MTYNATIKPYSPSSSPPSSPATNPWPDSSPFSSPNLGPLRLTDDDDIEIDESVRTIPADPFAGSYISHPKKRPITRESSENIPVKKARYVARECSPTNLNSQEECIWEAASTKAYEEGCRVFPLMDRQLTRIPPQFILDLQKMVVLPSLDKLLKPGVGDTQRAVNASTNAARRFRRVQTEPANAAREFRRSFSDRAESFNNSSLIRGEEHDNIQLFLSKNEISELPRELWQLNNLTVLTLRGNNISYLPPEISNLKSLRDLNVANNKLQFVPSELKNMILHDLQVHPNPFLTKPSPPGPGLKSVSETKDFFPSGIPSLVELALRGLLSKANTSPTDKDSDISPIPSTVLEQLYELPLPIGSTWRPFSVPLAKILNACVPGCLPRDNQTVRQDADDESRVLEIRAVGQCPNPRHWDGSRSFLRHAEERFSWETQLAGIKVGGHVPVLWRGCGRGCLSFLDGQKEDDCEDDDDDSDFEPAAVTFADPALGFDD